MRVGLIAPPWVAVPPPTYGGTEAVLDALARGLAAAGHEVRLFTTGDATCPVSRQWLYRRARGFGDDDAVTEARHVMAAYEALGDCDVIHDHTSIGPLLASRATAPVVTTAHGPLGGDAGGLYPRIAERASIIAISEAQRAQAPEVPVAAVIHHGIDAAEVPVGDGSGGYVAFLGRMAPEKGAHRAVRAAKRAGVPIRLAAKMWMPAERRYFEERVAPLLGDAADFVGEVGPREKLALLGGASALLAPLRWCEPFGMVLLEALACGTPVLAYPEGAAPEIVRHGATGLLCCDEDGLAAAIGDVHRLDRSACRRDAELRFSVERMVGDHERLYEAVLAGDAPVATSVAG